MVGFALLNISPLYINPNILLPEKFHKNCQAAFCTVPKRRITVTQKLTKWNCLVKGFSKSWAMEIQQPTVLWSPKVLTEAWLPVLFLRKATHSIFMAWKENWPYLNWKFWNYVSSVNEINAGQVSRWVFQFCFWERPLTQYLWHERKPKKTKILNWNFRNYVSITTEINACLFALYF